MYASTRGLSGIGMSCDDRVVLDGLFDLRAGQRRRQRRRQREQLVDRRRLVLLLREPVAVGERLHLVGADPIDQPVEMLADARLGAAAVGRFEQDVHGLVELLPRRFDVPELELALAGLEMLLRERRSA